jgi:hypothetical protein
MINYTKTPKDPKLCNKKTSINVNVKYRPPKSNRKTSQITQKLYEDSKKRLLLQQSPPKTPTNPHKNTKFPLSRLQKPIGQTLSSDPKPSFQPTISKTSKILAQKSRKNIKNPDLFGSEEKPTDNKIYERRVREKQ